MAGTNLGTAYVQIVPSAEGISGAIESALGGEATAAGMASGSNFAGAMGKGIATAGAITAAAATAATAAMASLSKEAITQYKDYEQLAGGVEKLYGDASGKVQSFADMAYRTSGMSANQYMETATSFSASLIGSLNGDVQKAAELTDLAMRSMSDNVNVFGSDAQSVQNAYQGFAKQNWTMLDNLKLGYGGTRSEMERLIADANKWAEENGKAAGLSIDSFADVVTAIDYIQQAQNIAGTTGKEAMTTIEGSATATKAAWENVLTSIGRGENIGESIQGLVNSIFGENEGEGLLNQILPRIETTFDGIGEFIATASPIFADKIPTLIEGILPTILESGGILVENLAKGLIEALPFIVESATQIGIEFLNTVMGLLPEVATLAMQLVANLATSIGEAAPELIPDAVNTIIDTILALLENVDALVDGAIALVMGLTDGIMNALPILMERLPEIIIKLVEALVLNAPKLAGAGPQLILALIQGIIGALPDFLMLGPRLVTGLLEALMNDAPKMAEGGIASMQNLIEGIVGMIPDLLALPVEIVMELVSTFADAAPNLIESGQALVEAVGEGISNLIDNAVQWGSDLIDSFVSGIMDNVDRVISAAESVASSIQDIIGFSEPDKGPLSNFSTYAPDMMKLFAQGIKDNTDLVTNQIKESFDFKDDILDSSVDVSANSSSGSQSGFTQNLTINAPESLDPSEIARMTRNANREMVLQLRTT